MEDWRRTAEAASIQNLIGINLTIEAVQAIDDAEAPFALAATICARFSQALPYQPGAGAQYLHLQLPNAMLRVWSAILATRRLGLCHAASGHVFSAGAARIGLLQGVAHAPWWWQRWEGHRAVAAAHADMAVQSLRSARSHGRAAIYVIGLFPLSRAWGPAAEQLLRRAIHDLAMAKAALELMRPAVVAEFSDARMLLSR